MRTQAGILKEITKTKNEQANDEATEQTNDFTRIISICWKYFEKKYFSSAIHRFRLSQRNFTNCLCKEQKMKWEKVKEMQKSIMKYAEEEGDCAYSSKTLLYKRPAA